MRKNRKPDVKRNDDLGNLNALSVTTLVTKYIVKSYRVEVLRMKMIEQKKTLNQNLILNCL